MVGAIHVSRAVISSFAGGLRRCLPPNSSTPKQCSQEDFYGYLKKNILGKISDVTKASCMQKEMEMGTFLPKQTVKDNSVIPYQIHLYELNAILKNLEDKVPLLKENGEKIQKIFTFRIPYYVGPLNGIRKKGE